MTKGFVSPEVKIAISNALERGYEVSPEAIVLLESLIEIRGEKTSASVNSIFETVVEGKAKADLENKIVSQGPNTITVDDIKRFGRIFVSEADNSVDDLSKAEADVLQHKDITIQPPVSVNELGDFATLFRSRYDKILRIFKQRPEAGHLVNISDVNETKGVSRVCGLVLEREVSDSGTHMVIDDPSGSLMISRMKDDMKLKVESLLVDQCVMVEFDVSDDDKLNLRKISEPDVPFRSPPVSATNEYVVFLSDLHVGSKKFLELAFQRFLDWLNAKGVTDDERDLIKRIKYVVIGGDIVDGVGVFPNQENELIETNIMKQYEIAAAKLRMIPERINVFIIPGNHDSSRQALPQPKIPYKYAPNLYELPNVSMLSDPAEFKLSGLKIMSYHGRSLDDILAVTPGLSYERPTEAMKILLKARHLAPVFGMRTPIAPDVEDKLVIDDVPDVFHSGHVHTVGAESYRGTILVNSGTWQAQTSYQMNLGITPTPGVVPLLNIGTLEITFKEFLVSRSIEAN